MRKRSQMLPSLEVGKAHDLYVHTGGLSWAWAGRLVRAPDELRVELNPSRPQVRVLWEACEDSSLSVRGTGRVKIRFAVRGENGRLVEVASCELTARLEREARDARYSGARRAGGALGLRVTCTALSPRRARRAAPHLGHRGRLAVGPGDPEDRLIVSWRAARPHGA